MRKYVVLTALLVLYSIVLSITYNPVWVLILLSAGVVYGVLSNIVALRRLYFLAGASPHIALLAVILSIPTSRLLGGSELFYAFLYGLLLIYIAGYMIHRGVSVDTATALIVGATASLTVLTIYHVLVHYPIEFSLSALITGDPLLTTWFDVCVAVAIAVVTVSTITLTFHEQLSIGVDRESTILSGINTRIYDLIVYTLIAVGVVGLLKIVGYILEHVLVLLPPGIVLARARSAWDALLLSIMVTTTSSLLGLHLALLLNQSPPGLIGIILLILYIAVYLGRRR